MVRRVKKELIVLDRNKKVAIVFVCQKGTHRSESCRNVFDKAFRDAGFEVTFTEALSLRDCVAETNGGSGCNPDTWSDKEKEVFEALCRKV